MFYSFHHNIQIKVLAENGDYKDYTLTINVVSSNTSILELTVDDEDVEKTDNNTYRYFIEPNATKAVIHIKTDDENAKVKYEEIEYKEVMDKEINLNGEITEVKFKIIAQGGTEEENTLYIYKKSKDSSLLKLWVEGNEVISEDGKNYKVEVTEDLNKVTVKAQTTNEFANVKIGNTLAKVNISEIEQALNAGKDTTINIEVTAQNGEISTYTLTISYKASSGVRGKIYTENINEIHKAKISIYKSLDDGSKNVGTELIVETYTNNDGTYEVPIYKALSTINDKNGNNIPDELECKYDIVISKEGYLDYTILGVKLIEEQNIELGEYSLIAGDVIKTGEIEIDDLVNLNNNIGVVINESNKEEKSIYDLNEDEVVDAKDRAILKKNYGKLAEIVEWVNPGETEEPEKAEEQVEEVQGEEQPVEEMQSKKLKAKTIEKQQMILPMKSSYKITAEYGLRKHPITGEEKKHKGIDISGEHHTEIYAVEDGEITYAGVQKGYGNCIEIKHIVNGETIYTFYAHLSKINVKVGDKIAQETVIGLEGGDPKEDNNPGTSTGHHLHFEIRTNNHEDIDPTTYIKF